MWYKVDFNNLAVLLLPTRNRRPKMIAYVKTLVAGINDLYDEFIKRRDEDLFKLNHNGQVCYMRGALNDKFDMDLRRIEILDGNHFVANYIYTPVEEKPKYLGTMFLYSKKDYEDTRVDFIVRVPAKIYKIRKHELHNWVNYLKKGVKKYKIETF